MISYKPGNSQEYPEIHESKNDTRKYPVIYFTNPTRYLVFFAKPDPILKNPTRWALADSTQIYFEIKFFDFSSY